MNLDYDYRRMPMSIIYGSHLLIHTAEVLKNVVHAAFLQHLTRMGLSKAVNPHAVHLIHLTLHKTTTSLSDSHHVQQIGCCQQSLDQIQLLFSVHVSFRQE